MSAYFVTSTGTDIGKTFVTAGLIRYLRGAGASPDALKPVWLALDRAERDAVERRRLSTGPQDRTTTAEAIRQRLQLLGAPTL